jgi:8-oxo-dGTP pyrophosphatase MutT (NUDIX family)
MVYDVKLIEALRAQLRLPLPGEDAQYRMAPSYRPRLKRDEINALMPRISGVLVLLYEKNGELHLVFTKRKSYEGVHSGQMSFPGGKKDEGDTDLIHTALRETDEEIGIPPTQIELLGSLSELYIPPSNFLVYPSVGFTPVIHSFRPQESEVEEVVEIPLSFFMDTKNVSQQTEIKLFNGAIVRVPAYVFNNHIIWGATAIMLSEFTYVVEQAAKEI